MGMSEIENEERCMDGCQFRELLYSRLYKTTKGVLELNHTNLKNVQGMRTSFKNYMNT